MGSNKINGGVQGGRPVGQADRAERAKDEPNKAFVLPPLKPITEAELKRIAGERRAPKTPRLRFAPSPTGHLHIGGARTALMNFLAARKLGGEFVLRIEDTDQQRSKQEYTDAILAGLKWLGIKWDGQIEYQSKRTALHKKKVQELIDKKKAYRDDTGAVYFKMPEEGTLTVHDRVKGTVTINIADSEGNTDFVIQRSDGTPTFLLANVVDDGDMGITHVIRGDDHLTNAARQILLFRALGYEVPEFYHLPLIHGDPQKDPETGELKPTGKLSKRHGATSVIQYQDMGYDPNVLTNHLARLGMGYGTDATLTVDELSKRFDLLDFSSSPSPIQKERLDNRNLHFIAKMPLRELVAETKRRLADKDGLVALFASEATQARLGLGPEEAIASLTGLDAKAVEALADGAKARAHTFAEVLEIGALARAEPLYDAKEDRAYMTPQTKAVLGKLKDALARVDDFSIEKVDAALERFNDQNGVGYRAYGKALRYALTGLSDGLPLHDLLVLIGKDEALKRMAR